jgi:hypothetical protein
VVHAPQLTPFNQSEPVIPVFFSNPHHPACCWSMTAAGPCCPLFCLPMILAFDVSLVCGYHFPVSFSFLMIDVLHADHNRHFYALYFVILRNYSFNFSGSPLRSGIVMPRERDSVQINVPYDTV